MSVNPVLKKFLRPIYRSKLAMPFRASHLAARSFNNYYGRHVLSVLSTSFRRPNETSNFTYDLVPRNLIYLAHTLAVVLRRPIGEIRGFIEEARTDSALHEALYSGLMRAGTAATSSSTPSGAGWDGMRWCAR
jgi:hypothetical protein